MMNMTKEQVEDLTKWDCERMRNMQAYIAIRGAENVTENVDVPEHWQLNKLEHVVQGRNLLEVQVVEKSSGRIIFNLWWMP